MKRSKVKSIPPLAQSASRVQKSKSQRSAQMPSRPHESVRGRHIRSAQTNGRSPTPEDKHTIFTRWCIEVGIRIKGVAPQEIPGKGMGLVATQSISRGEEVIFVPEECMLTPSDLSIDDFDLSPQARLTAALIEMHKENNDVYRMCSSVWPTADDFQSSVAWYKHENIHMFDSFPRALSLILKRLDADASKDFGLITDIYDDESTVYPAILNYCWAIANTRSFSWKPDGRYAGQMVIYPFLDYMNHCPAKQEQTCEVRMENEGYYLYAVDNIEPGEEILAPYGSHSNDKLLAHYGFTIPHNPDDLVLLDEIVLPCANEVVRENLESSGYYGNYNMTIDYEGEPTPELCFRTQVAVRCQLLTSNEWEHFVATGGQDIAEDKTSEVEDTLCFKIAPALHEFEARQHALIRERDRTRSQTTRVILDGVVTRWQQIIEGLEQFLQHHDLTRGRGP